MAAGQPQSYGSIREFLDNLPNQPCIWQPENANICVTCLRINEPVARICSVWAPVVALVANLLGIKIAPKSIQKSFKHLPFANIPPRDRFKRPQDRLKRPQ